jgi:hypothetical protein
MLKKEILVPFPAPIDAEVCLSLSCRARWQMVSFSYQPGQVKVKYERGKNGKKKIFKTFSTMRLIGRFESIFSGL